ncbi:MAG: DUF1801 domain-containing protein [Bacteroidales bacterium]
MIKFQSISQLYDILPEQERIIVDVLRQLISENLPEYCREKLSFNVPYFYGNKGICIIWPSTVPGGGIKSGVFFGYWYGNKLIDEDGYLTHGTNKQIYYKIYQSVNEIDTEAILKLLKEAVRIDAANISIKSKLS